MKEANYNRMPKHSTGLYILLLGLVLLGLVVLPSFREGFSERLLPRTIWSYWNDPNPPVRLRKILDDRRDALPGWSHRLLNETTIYGVIPRDAFPRGYGALSHQAKSDWIRLYLLKVYGGCWMDASIIVNRPDEIEELYTQSVEQRSELTGYANADGDTSYIESFCIMAPLGSKVISLWFEEFTLAITMGFLPYKRRVFAKIDASKCYAEDNDDTYLTVYAALQYVLQERIDYTPSIHVINVWNSMYKYQAECEHDNKCVVEKIKSIPKADQPANLKLTRFNRTFYDT